MKLPKGQLTDPRCLVQQPCRLQEVTLALVGLGHHREDLGIIPVALPDTAEVVGMAPESRKVLVPEAIEHAATVADVPGPNPPRECQVRFRKPRPPPFHGVDRLREEVHAGVVPDLGEPVVAGDAESVHKDPPPPRQMAVLIVGVGDPGHHEVLLNVVGPPGCRDFGANGLGHLHCAAKALIVGAEEGDHGVRQVPRADSADVGEPSARIEQDVVEVGGLPLGPDVLKHDVAVASSVEKAPVDGVEPLSVGAVDRSGRHHGKVAPAAFRGGIDDVVADGWDPHCLQVAGDELDHSRVRRTSTDLVAFVVVRALLPPIRADRWRFQIEVHHQDALAGVRDLVGHVQEGQGATDASLEGVERDDVHQAATGCRVKCAPESRSWASRSGGNSPGSAWTGSGLASDFARRKMAGS